MTDGRWRAALRGAAGRLLPGGRPQPSGRPSKGASPDPADDAPTPARPRYAPVADGRPDPGEVVWAWVPYEDDPRRGKDRPVLVLAVQGGSVVALMLSSRDHDVDAADEARHGRVWLDVGSGAWDGRGRPSEVRLDRLLRLQVADVRREGAALDPQRYDEVVRAAARLHGW